MSHKNRSYRQQRLSPESSRPVRVNVDLVLDEPRRILADKAVMAEGIGGGGYNPPVVPGQQDVVQQITLVYEIK